MSKIREKIQSVESWARRRALNSRLAVAGVHVVAIGIFPTVETIYFSSRDELESALGAGFWAILILIVVAHTAVGFLAYSSTTAQHVYFDYLDLARENDDLKQEIEAKIARLRALEVMRLSAHYAILAVYRFTAWGDAQKPLQVKPVREWLGKTLRVAIDKREEIIGYQGAKYNFAVYLYSERTDRLEKFYREVDNRIDTRNRSWPPGVGHVGLCFARQEAIISEDITKAPALMVEKEEEQTDYRSIATSPIFSIGEDNGTTDVRGVFIITSSEPGQLTEERHELFVSTMGWILSLFFHESDQHIAGGQNYV